MAGGMGGMAGGMGGMGQPGMGQPGMGQMALPGMGGASGMNNTMNNSGMSMKTLDASPLSIADTTARGFEDSAMSPKSPSKSRTRRTDYSDDDDEDTQSSLRSQLKLWSQSGTEIG